MGIMSNKGIPENLKRWKLLSKVNKRNLKVFRKRGFSFEESMEMLEVKYEKKY